MRTTLDLQPAVVDAARSIASHTGKSLGLVISELALKGLTATRPKRKRSQFPIFPVPPGEPPINLAVVKQLLDDEGLSS